MSDVRRERFRDMHPEDGMFPIHNFVGATVRTLSVLETTGTLDADSFPFLSLPSVRQQRPSFLLLLVGANK